METHTACKSPIDYCQLNGICTNIVSEKLHLPSNHTLNIYFYINYVVIVLAFFMSFESHHN